MGKASRDKGARAEREAVRILQNAGLASERVPLSGAAGGRYCGDVSVPVLGVDRTLEVKCRATGWKQAYKYLGQNYGLVIRADREEPLMVLRLKDFAQLAITADAHRPVGNEFDWLAGDIASASNKVRDTDTIPDEREG